MRDCYDGETCFCWNGCDDALQEVIRRNNFVKDVRSKLAKKKFQKRFKEEQAS